MDGAAAALFAAGIAARTKGPIVWCLTRPEPSRRQLQDIVTCIRTNTTIVDVGFDRERHADRYLKPPEEMERLFPRYPEAVARTMEIVEQCRFSLEELTTRRRR